MRKEPYGPIHFSVNVLSQKLTKIISKIRPFQVSSFHCVEQNVKYVLKPLTERNAVSTKKKIVLARFLLRRNSDKSILRYCDKPINFCYNFMQNSSINVQLVLCVILFYRMELTTHSVSERYMSNKQNCCDSSRGVKTCVFRQWKSRNQQIFIVFLYKINTSRDRKRWLES